MSTTTSPAPSASAPTNTPTAYFKNAHACDNLNRSSPYSNDLTTQDVLVEYATRANYESVCTDGAKRDRLVWLGDFHHTARISAASTSRTDQSRGTLPGAPRHTGTKRTEEHLTHPRPRSRVHCGRPHSRHRAAATGLQDYQLLGLIVFNDHVRLANDLDFARAICPQWQKVVDWLLPQINSTTGLLLTFGGGFAFTGTAGLEEADMCVIIRAPTKIQGKVVVHGQKGIKPHGRGGL